MGWNISLKSNKEITESEIDEIVNSEEYLYKDIFTSKQYWGWSTKVDINLPEGNEMSIGGCYTTSELGKPVAELLKKLLENRGHIVELEYNW